jgi:plastocyanin
MRCYLNDYRFGKGGVMGQQFRDTVQNESQPVGFTPQPGTGHQVGSIQVQDMQVSAALGSDSVFWFNADHQTSHQPYPTNGKPGDWGPVVAPQASSQQLNPPASGVYAYQCALHPGETGQINVANAIAIGTALGGGAVFNPNPLVLPAVAPLPWGVPAQTVSWANSDSNPHQPTPNAGPAWFTAPIQPGNTSAQVTASNGDTPYYCKLHPAETALLQNPVNIDNSTPGNSGGLSFSPANATAYAGQTISWTNNDTVAHQPAPVGGPANAWFAAPIAAGATVSSNAFPTAGNFTYECDGAGPQGTVTIS